MAARKFYGVSSKYAFGSVDHRVYVFDNKCDAVQWLHTEEYDFRERELMTRTKAVN